MKEIKKQDKEKRKGSETGERKQSKNKSLYVYTYMYVYILSVCAVEDYLEEELGIVPSGTSHVVLPSGP
jgi:hypothetical protein